MSVGAGGWVDCFVLLEMKVFMGCYIVSFFFQRTKACTFLKATQDDITKIPCLATFSCLPDAVGNHARDVGVSTADGYLQNDARAVDAVVASLQRDLRTGQHLFPAHENTAHACATFSFHSLQNKLWMKLGMLCEHNLEEIRFKL